MKGGRRDYSPQQQPSPIGRKRFFRFFASDVALRLTSPKQTSPVDTIQH